MEVTKGQIVGKDDNKQYGTQAEHDDIQIGQNSTEIADDRNLEHFITTEERFPYQVVHDRLVVWNESFSLVFEGRDT